jgi:hypothetical protein
MGILGSGPYSRVRCTRYRTCLGLLLKLRIRPLLRLFLVPAPPGPSLFLLPSYPRLTFGVDNDVRISLMKRRVYYISAVDQRPQMHLNIRQRPSFEHSCER